MRVEGRDGRLGADIGPALDGAPDLGPDPLAVVPRMRVAAIIPVGTLEGAKTRLGGTLDAEERHDLVEGLLTRTVVTALAVDRLEDVLVISPDRDVLARATELGARTLRQRSRGLNAGLREARADVVAGGADAILILPIDLPFVTAEAVAAVIAPLLESPDGSGTEGAPTAAPAERAEAAERAEPAEPRLDPSLVAELDGRSPDGRHPRVVLVTDRHGNGTNALGLRPPSVIDFAFGPGSRRAHRSAAGDAGATYIEVEGPLMVDLDTPDDLVFVESTEAERLGVG